MKKKILVAIIATVTMTVPMFGSIPAFADSTTKAQLETSISQNKQKEIATQEQLEKLDNQIQNTMTKAQSLDGKISSANANIASLQTQISNTQTELSVNEQKMSQEIAGLYKAGYANNGLLAYINVLISGKSFSQIITNLQDIYSINKSNQQTLDKIKAQESTLKNEQDSLKSNVETLKNSKAEITSTLAEQNAAKSKENTMLNSIQGAIQHATAQEIAMQQAEVQADLKAEAAKAAEAAKQAEATKQAAQPKATTSTSSQATNLQSTSKASTSSSSSKSNSGSMVVTTANGNVVKSTAGNHAYIPNHAQASGQASAVIAEAEKFIGVPYVWGGESPSGFDCSGLMQYVFGAEGVGLPRTAAEQQQMGTPVPRGDLQPGDLVFWGDPAYHVAMYIGNGQIIAAPHTGAYVSIMGLYPYTNARRVL